MLSTRRHNASAETIRKSAIAHGALGAKILSAKNIFVAEWVRWKCRFGCDGFGSTLLCPPHSPTPSETRLMLSDYSRSILIHCSANTDMRELISKLEREAFLGGFYKAFGFARGPCELCKACAFEEGCRHPEKARPAMEACGIDVFKTARGAGFPIEVVKDFESKQHYYGLLLLE